MTEENIVLFIPVPITLLIGVERMCQVSQSDIPLAENNFK